MLFADIAPHVHFLSDAAHLLAKASPETSAFIMSRRAELLVENDVSVSISQRQHICSCCGHIMIPGNGSTLNIKTDKAPRSKRKDKQHQNRRTMPGGTSKVVTCGHCGRDSRVKLDGPSRISRQRKMATQPINIQRERQPQSTESANKPSANASSKKRTKNRKAGLQALLDQKQGSTTSASSGFGLSLSDFMKK